MRPHRQWTELELFEAIGREDEFALRELEKRIDRCIRWRLGRGTEIELEEIRDRVREKLEGLRRRGFSGNSKAFRVYLYRIVASQVVEIRRERAGHLSLDTPVQMPGGETTTLQALAKELIDPHWDVLKVLETREEQELVRIAFARLNDRCRQLLLEREVDRRAEQEIAIRLKMTLSSVWVSLHRCKERLYRLLLGALCAGSNPDWRAMVSRLGEKLVEPLATVFRLWWNENRTIREIAKAIQRHERETKELLARAKAAVWQLARESGAL